MNNSSKDNISVKIRDAIKSAPHRWHSLVGIDTDLKTQNGTACPFGCGGEGTDRLYKAQSFDTDGAVCCRHEGNKIYDAFEAVKVKFGVDYPAAVKMLSELYAVDTAADDTARANKTTAKTSSSKRTVTQRRNWIYRNADGTPRYKVDRADYSDGAKDCFQLRYDTATGSYVKGMTGVELVPLHQPEIVNNSETPIIIVEGEKCCDAIRELSDKTGTDFGIVTTASGGSNTKLDWTKFVHDRPVYLFTDSDVTGRKYMNRVGKALTTAGCDVRFIDFYPDETDGRDVADFIDSFADDYEGAAERLAIMLDNADVFQAADEVESADNDTERIEKQRLVVTRLSDEQPEVIEWVWDGHIPRGHVTFFMGKPSIGKSALLHLIVAKLSVGFFGKQETIAYFITEESGGIIRVKTENSGADIENIFTIKKPNGQNINWKQWDEAIDEAIKNDATVIVIDPLVNAISGLSENKAEDMGMLLSNLEAKARDNGLTILIAHHAGKGQVNDGIDFGRGSSAIQGAARCVWSVMEKPDGGSIAVNTKQSLAKKAKSIEFHIVEVNKIGIAEIDNYESELKFQDFIQNDNATENGIDCQNWLREFLADGAKPATEVFNAGQEEGFVLKQLKRARTKIGVKTHKEGFQGKWMWELPAQRFPKESKDSQIEIRESLDSLGESLDTVPFPELLTQYQTTTQTSVSEQYEGNLL
ncbi:MAG: AAA family ATPase [Planctomycetaceae bacterium]|jgi:RecA-family ATPase/5S rRNA maturation endonuclease (ribonuclease M5)|nr:AAA family ATPase [Planctomycetaceae bacterium]